MAVCSKNIDLIFTLKEKIFSGFAHPPNCGGIYFGKLRKNANLAGIYFHGSGKSLYLAGIKFGECPEKSSTLKGFFTVIY